MNRKQTPTPANTPARNTSSSNEHQAQSPESMRFTLLTTLDFKSIEELDPSLSDGHRIVFDKEVPVEMRTEHESGESHDVGTLEAIRVKIMTLGEEKTLNIRLELSSEADLFFHFSHSLSSDSYAEVQQMQKLMVDYDDYPKVLAKMLTSCIKEPESYLCIFVMHSNGCAQLNFVKNMEYKFVELLSLECIESPEHIIRNHISYRYNSLKSRLTIMQSRLQDICALVKLKNPSLLLQLQRSTTPSSPSATTFAYGSPNKK